MSDQVSVTTPPASSTENLAANPKVDPIAKAIVAAKLNGQPQTEGEPITPPPPTAEAKPGINSAQFSVLARKEKAILARMKEVQTKEANLEKLVEEKFNMRLSELKALAKGNPMKALETLETDYSTVTKHFLNGNAEPTPDDKIAEVKNEILTWKQEQAAAAQKAKEDQEQAESAKVEAAIQSFQQEIKQFVVDNTATYELINLYSASDHIYSTINDYWEQTGKVLEIKDAADLVEEYIAEMASNALKTKRFAPKTETAPAKAVEKPTTPTKTLNNVTSSVPSMLTPRNEQDRLNRAMAALNRQK